MLFKPDILKLLEHADPEVRKEAAHYLRQLPDDSPTQTLSALWQAFDHYGTDSTDIVPGYATFLSSIAEVGADAQTIARSIERLRTLDPADELQTYFDLIIRKTDVSVLAPFRDELEKVLNASQLAAIDERFAKAKLPPDTLWTRLMEVADLAEKAKSSDEVDHGTARLLTEALRQHQDFVIPRAMAMLSDPTAPYFARVWCIELLGYFRHAPAIPAMLEAHRTDPGDFLREGVAECLGRMPAEQAVPLIEAALPLDPNQFNRMSLASALGRIKDPLSEAALLRLMPGETSSSAFTGMCTALCDLFTTDGLESLRQAVIEDRYDPSIDDITERLVLLCDVTGFAPPELPAWKELTARQLADRRKRQKYFASILNPPSRSSKGNRRNPPKPDFHDMPSEPITPIRRESPKIGRNDPCPCGSGKKHKKCCGK
jgi:HEAT repeat protein